MEDYHDYEPYDAPPQNWKTLRNIAFASLGVGLFLSLIKDAGEIRGPSSGGSAFNFTTLFLSSVLGRAIGCLILPLIVFGIAKLYSLISKKPVSIAKTLWVVWVVTVSISVLGQFTSR
jgi:hypothetical protein